MTAQNVKLAQLVSPELETQFAALLALKMPRSVAFKLVGIRKVIRDKVAQFHELRDAAAGDHANKGEDGKPVMKQTPVGLQFQMTAENQVAFGKVQKELEETVVEGIPTVTCSELGPKAEPELTGAIIAALDGILLDA